MDARSRPHCLGPDIDAVSQRGNATLWLRIYSSNTIYLACRTWRPKSRDKCFRIPARRPSIDIPSYIYLYIYINDRINLHRSWFWADENLWNTMSYETVIPCVPSLTDTSIHSCCSCQVIMIRYQSMTTDLAWHCHQYCNWTTQYPMYWIQKYKGDKHFLPAHHWSISGAIKNMLWGYIWPYVNIGVISDHPLSIENGR